MSCEFTFPKPLPYKVETVLDNMNLRQYPFGRDYLQDYLTSPQSLLDLYNTRIGQSGVYCQG